MHEAGYERPDETSQTGVEFEESSVSSLDRDSDLSGALARIRRFRAEDVAPLCLSAIGVALVLLVVVEWILFARLRLALILHPVNLTGLLTSAPSMAALVYGGHWLARSDVAPDRYVRVVGWCAAGITVSSAMNLLIMSTTPVPDPWYLVGWLRWAMSIGGGVGLLVGVIEARAIERERTAERATVRADYAESRREWFDYLNSLLRHEVLNTSNVISGRSALLLEEYDPDDEARSHLETITRQSEDLTRVIRDVRVLLEATDRDPQYEAIDLASTLEAEVASLHDGYEGVRTELSVADDLTVMADDLLPRLFSNLLSNAVEHNDGDSPEVHVTGEKTGDSAVVRIADDGPGIPAEQLETLFERDTTKSTTHGLGLFIVRTLADRYGGTVALTETGPDGTTITVELPLAERGPDPAARDVAVVPPDSE